MKEKFIVGISVKIMVEASSATAALQKIANKFGKYHIDEISVYDEKGDETGLSIHPTDADKTPL